MPAPRRKRRSHPSLAVTCFLLLGACSPLAPAAPADACLSLWIDADGGAVPADGFASVAHRGYADCFPENTIESILAADSLGASGVEIDIRLTRDGVPVLMHDSTVDRTTSGRGYVADQTLSVVRRWNACPTTSRPCRVPTLTEALATGSKELEFVLDLKGSFGRAGLERVDEAIRGAGARNRTRIITGSLPLLEAARRDFPQLEASFVYILVPGWETRHDRMLHRLRELSVREVVMTVRDVADHRRVVEQLVALGMEVTVATARTERDVDVVTGAGLRSLFTDRPLALSSPPRPF